MAQVIRTTIASDLDQDRLQAELTYGGEELAYVYHKPGGCVIEIYPRYDGRPWLINVDDFVAAVEEAKLALISEAE
jgi:hypothetical protein